MILVAIPIKPFGVAKARLEPVLDPGERSKLGRAVAAHTAEIAAEAGGEVFVVTSDHGVEHWAKQRGLGVIREDPRYGHGLDGAAATAARYAEEVGMRWAIVHADLPVATVEDLAAVLTVAAEQPTLVPSHDGGTNVLASAPPGFRFSYGAASFHRHLRAVPEAVVITNPRLALDLDTPADLQRALATSSGSWLNSVL